MRIFLSAGEPSGDLHGGNLVQALRRLDPALACVGFGGARMEAAGTELLYPLCRLAVMGFLRVVPSLPKFWRVLQLAERSLQEARPDALVLIDFPGFHWWLARRAHRLGIPVIYFVPPQLWAWAGWRVRKMRRWVDHVLCNLPFEEDWYRVRGVPAHWVGHPYFDELTRQRLDDQFLADQRNQSGPVIGLLPGSRGHEVEHNLTTLMRAAARVRAVRPDVRFMVACYQEAHRVQIAAYLKRHPLAGVELHVGRTAEIIHLAHSTVAVSGSVGLELLHHGKPSVVVYRTSAVSMGLVRLLKNSPYISLVNLLAGRELFPEYLSSRCEAEAVSRHLLHWLEVPAAYEALVHQLHTLREQVGQAGACQRAAAYIFRVAGGTSLEAAA